MEVEPQPESRLADTSSGIVSSVARPMAPVSSYAPRRVEEPESEDDIPLSEVSRMNEETPTTSGTKSHSGLKRERSLERTAETSRRGVGRSFVGFGLLLDVSFPQRNSAATTTTKKVTRLCQFY